MKLSGYVLSLILILAGSGFAIPPAPPPSESSSAFFKSLVLPGWGQYSQERNERAMLYATSEVAMILTAVGLQTYGDWLRQDYKSVAVAHSGVADAGSRSHLFYVDMGNWMTTAEYNAARARDREFERQYLANTDQWSWSSDSDRRRFKDLRIRSDKALDAVKFALGGMFINHLVSAIDASNYARLHPKSKKSPTVKVGLTGSSSEPQLSLSLNW